MYNVDQRCQFEMYILIIVGKNSLSNYKKKWFLGDTDWCTLQRYAYICEVHLSDFHNKKLEVIMSTRK